MMSTRESLEHVLDHGGAELITEAVKRAESITAGEIVVCVEQALPSHAASPRAAAQAAFEALVASRTAAHNGVLLYIALNERAIEVVADEAAAAKIPQSQWQEIVDLVAVGFRADVPTEAIIMAVTRVGELLACHFPRLPDDINELPDSPAHCLRPGT